MNNFSSCLENFFKKIEPELRRYNECYNLDAQARFRKELVFYSFMDLLGYRNFSTSDITEAAIVMYDSLREIKEQLKDEDYEIILRAYSDNVGLIIPTKADLFYSPLPESVWIMFKIPALYQLNLSLKGFPIRGALSIGKLLFNEEIMAGEILVRTYDLEENYAKYPRILVDEMILKYIKCLKKHLIVKETIKNIKESLEKNLAHITLQPNSKEDLIRINVDWIFVPRMAILQDSQGLSFINYLWHFAEEIYNALSLPFIQAKLIKFAPFSSKVDIESLYSSDDKFLIKKVVLFIINNIDHHKKFILDRIRKVGSKEGITSRIGEKYLWMLKFHNFFIDSFLCTPAVEEILNTLFPELSPLLEEKKITEEDLRDLNNEADISLQTVLSKVPDIKLAKI